MSLSFFSLAGVQLLQDCSPSFSVSWPSSPFGGSPAVPWQRHGQEYHNETRGTCASLSHCLELCSQSPYRCMDTITNQARYTWCMVSLAVCKFSGHCTTFRLHAYSYISTIFLPFVFQSDSPYSDPVDGLCHGDGTGICRVQPPQLHVVDLKEHSLPLRGCGSGAHVFK